MLVYPPFVSRTPASGSLTVGLMAVRLPTQPANDLVIQWDSANTGTIYIGASNTVTASNAGFVLDTNSRSLPMSVSNVDNFYAIASSAGQVLRWVSS